MAPKDKHPQELRDMDRELRQALDECRALMKRTEQMLRLAEDGRLYGA